MSVAMDKISYADLYARWERGHWRATDIDFSADRSQWQEGFSELERKAALWNYSMFFHGEDAVADDLAPFIDAAPLEEQKYFLATQQVDEARHSVFFHRFMHEVVERGDGTIAGGLRATEPELTWGFRRTFEMLDEVTGVLRKDRSRTALARAVTMYHFIVEATLAQPGQHFIGDYLERRELLPGFREGMQHVAQDEQRHIGFGVKLLHDLAKEDPVEVPEAVADLLREVFPISVAVFVPPGWAPSTPSASASRSRRSTRRARARSSPSCGWPASRSSRCPARRSTPTTCRSRSAPRARSRCCAPATSARRTAVRRATPSRWRCCSTPCAARSTRAPRPRSR